MINFFKSNKGLFWGIVAIIIYGFFHETFKLSQGTFILAFLIGQTSQNIKTIQNALSIVSKMRGVYFDWIESGNQSIGLIAQEAQEVIPELVLENVIKNPPSFPGEEVSEERILSVDYGKITAVLIEAIKEQQTQIEALKAQLNGN